MENFDLIIFTIVVTVSFVAFGISTYNEFSKAAKKDNR
jgi:hypothetical protein